MTNQTTIVVIGSLRANGFHCVSLILKLKVWLQLFEINAVRRKGVQLFRVNAVITYDL